MIVLAITACFFTGVNSYNFRQKFHYLSFFVPFCWEIIRVICTILVIEIEDLELRMHIKNLPKRKNATCFEPSSQNSLGGRNCIFTTMSIIQIWQTLDIANNYCLKILTHWSIRTYLCFKKIWIDTLPKHHDCIIVLFRKRVIA